MARDVCLCVERTRPPRNACQQKLLSVGTRLVMLPLPFALVLGFVQHAAVLRAGERADLPRLGFRPMTPLPPPPPRRLVPCICCDGGRVGGRGGDRVADNDRKPDRERKERGILWQPAQKAAETRLHEARLRLHKARLANVSRSAIRIARRLRGPTAPHREL